jgi:hypothetical protein
MDQNFLVVILFDLGFVSLPVFLLSDVDTSKFWFHTLSLDLDFMHPVGAQTETISLSHVFKSLPSHVHLLRFPVVYTHMLVSAKHRVSSSAEQRSDETRKLEVRPCTSFVY